MDKEKQIEEMAQVINEYGRTYDDGVKGCEDHLARFLYNAGYRKVVMCKDCVYCEEHHYEEEGEKPYIKLTCKWSKYAHTPTDFCSLAKMKGAE